MKKNKGGDILIKKDLEYYLKLNYPITIEKYIEYDGKEYFAAEIPDLPGCSAQGETIEEALKKLEEAKKAWIEVSLERGLEIPEPVTEDQFSGKFLLRISAKLHRQLAIKAKRANMSLNQYIRSILEKSLYEDQIMLKFQQIEERIEYLVKEIQEIKAYYREKTGEHLMFSTVAARRRPDRWSLGTTIEDISQTKLSRTEFTSEEYIEEV